MNLLHTWQCSCKGSNRLDFLHTVIERWNDRYSNHQIGLTRKSYPSGVLESQFIGLACKLLMLLLIGMLDIHQVSIQIRQYHLDIFPGNTCHTLDSCINSTLFRCAKKVTSKFRLAKTFATGKCHSTAGAVVIWTILLYQFDHLADSYVSSHGLHAVWSFHCLDLIFLGFRIAAPLTSEHTAFQKHNGTDSRTVMDGITLDVENTPCSV